MRWRTTFIKTRRAGLIRSAEATAPVAVAGFAGHVVRRTWFPAGVIRHGWRADHVT
jgi:hypothetical protein